MLFLRSLLCTLQSKGKVSAPGFASAWGRGVDEHPHIGRSCRITTPERRIGRFFGDWVVMWGPEIMVETVIFPTKRERERARVSRSSPLENLIFGLVLDLFISFRDSLDKEQDLQEDFVYTVHLL